MRLLSAATVVTSLMVLGACDCHGPADQEEISAPGVPAATVDAVNRYRAAAAAVLAGAPSGQDGLRRIAASDLDDAPGQIRGRGVQARMVSLEAASGCEPGVQCVKATFTITRAGHTWSVTRRLGLAERGSRSEVTSSS